MVQTSTVSMEDMTTINKWWLINWDNTTCFASLCFCLYRLWDCIGCMQTKCCIKLLSQTEIWRKRSISNIYIFSFWRATEISKMPDWFRLLPTWSRKMGSEWTYKLFQAQASWSTQFKNQSPPQALGFFLIYLAVFFLKGLRKWINAFLYRNEVGHGIHDHDWNNHELKDIIDSISKSN